ncbi:MAG: hypothetical protein VX860_02715 [Verrucomicrobiota bacterium]|nr:hypothetical protein [Verrucomicrobiota bacterium]
MESAGLGGLCIYTNEEAVDIFSVGSTRMVENPLIQDWDENMFVFDVLMPTKLQKYTFI